jgi:hypothetical protein
VGTYRIIQWLSTNAVSEFFLGKVLGEESPGKAVIIEGLLPAYARDADFSAPFLRAAKSFATLQHPNVVRMLEHGEANGRFYRVLEFVDGEELRPLLQAARAHRLNLGLREVCFILWQVAEGLDRIHAHTGPDGAPLRPSLHPSHVRIGRGGEVKLMDLGGSIESECDYFSPEQALGRLEGPRGDIFRLGLLLYEMLAGQPLFDGDDPHVLQKIGSFDAQGLAALPGVPPSLGTLLRHTLSAEPEARPASARQVADALRDFLLERELGVSAADLASLFARAFPNRRSPLDFLSRVHGEELTLSAIMPAIVRTDPRLRAPPGPPPVLLPVVPAAPTAPTTPRGSEDTPPVAAASSEADLLPRLQAQHSRLLDDALSLLGGSAALAPLLVRLTRGCVVRLGGDGAAEALAATAACTLALAARLEEPRRFVLPTLTRVRALASDALPELGGILSSVLLAGRGSGQPPGLIARALQCAAAFVIQVQRARPDEEESARALGILSEDPRLFPAAVEALAAELGVEPPIRAAPVRAVSLVPPRVLPCEIVTR